MAHVQNGGGEAGAGGEAANRPWWQVAADWVMDNARWLWDNVVVPAWEWLNSEEGQAVVEAGGSMLADFVKLDRIILGPVMLYVIEKETITLQGKLTRYPIEDKDELSDHIYNEPRKIRLKVWVGAIYGGWTSGGLDLGGPAAMHAALSVLQREKVVVPYVSKMAVWYDMVLTKYEPVLEPRAENGYLAELVLEQAKFGKEPQDAGAPDTPTDEGGGGGGGASGSGGGSGGQDKGLLKTIWDALVRLVTGGSKAPAEEGGEGTEQGAGGSGSGEGTEGGDELP